MTKINSFRDLTVRQVSMDLADVCFDIVEAIPYPYKFILLDPIGKRLHGLGESLELRLNSENA